MAYNIKDVFFLSTSATITNSTDGGGSAQLDLSAYIDPIARGRQKGTGLAVYKVQYSMGQGTAGEPIDDAEDGSCRYGLLAGGGQGDNATGAISPTTATFAMTQDNLISSGDFYGPRSMVANASSAPYGLLTTEQYVSPDKDVPYVIVRDNVVLIYDVGDQFASDHILSVRLSCAQISLDQATLNQLLRTQTV
tara:strand:+ start:58 stop:636 length:579 start_codon:yes stop_codon:yes gene_type:complete